jgi:hypothetical protein
LIPNGTFLGIFSLFGGFSLNPVVEGGFDHRTTAAPGAVTTDDPNRDFLRWCCEVTILMMVAGLSQVSVEVTNLEFYAIR